MQTQSEDEQNEEPVQLKPQDYVLVDCFTQVLGAPLKLGHLKASHLLESKVPQWKQHLTKAK